MNFRGKAIVISHGVLYCPISVKSTVQHARTFNYHDWTGIIHRTKAFKKGIYKAKVICIDFELLSLSLLQNTILNILSNTYAPGIRILFSFFLSLRRKNGLIKEKSPYRSIRADVIRGN